MVSLEMGAQLVDGVQGCVEVRVGVGGHQGEAQAGGPGGHRGWADALGEDASGQQAVRSLHGLARIAVGYAQRYDVRGLWRDLQTQARQPAVKALDHLTQALATFTT